MIQNTELVILIQTLAAAEQGSFHKAGLLLGVPASTISRRVRALEIQMGVKLFSRHRHGIRRTAVADGFLEQVRRVLNDLNLVLVNTSATKRGHTGRLRIGLYVSPWRGQLRAVLGAFRRKFPDVTIEYTDAARNELMKRLDAGAIDIAIFADHARYGAHEVHALWRERILVALPKRHHLAAKKRVSWTDLRREHIVLARDTGPDLKDYLMARLKTSGHLPAIHCHDIGRDFSLSLVGLEQEITLLYEADAGAQHPDVVYRDMTEREAPSLVPFFGCWMGDNDNPALQNFLDLLRRNNEIQVHDPDDPDDPTA